MTRDRSMSDYDALRIISPKTDKDRRSLVKLSAYLFGILCCVVGLLYLKSLAQERRERDWKSATATITDARPKLVSQHSRGMLYQVEILAEYPIDGVVQARWIVVAQVPTGLGDAEFNAARWKGYRCVVRWQPSDPSKVIAEVS